MPHIGEDSFSGEVSTEEGKASGREDHKESSFSKSKKLKDKRSGRKNSKKKGRRSGGGFGSYGDAGRTSIVGNGGRVLGCGTSMIITAVIIFVAVVVLAVMITNLNKNSGNVAEATAVSTINRTKLTDVADFNSSCIKDELEWIDDVSTTEEGLEPFYKKTGIQPYILIRGYDATLSSDEEKQEWANTYFSENISEQNAFLFVYFAEKNTSTDIGYMCSVSGASADALLDTEAMNVYWDNIQRYWKSDLSTDQVIIRAYGDTASSIMKHHTTQAEKTRNIIILVVVLLLLAVGLFFWKGKGISLPTKPKKKKKSQRSSPQKKREGTVGEPVKEEAKKIDPDTPLLTDEEMAEIRKKLGL